MVHTLRNSQGLTFFTTSYLPKENVVSNQWVGYQTHGGVIYGCESCLYALRQYHCPYLLNDNTQVTGTWKHAVDYCANEWAPLAALAGLTHFAHVLSPDASAAQSAYELMERIGPRFQMRIFTEATEALAWLRSCQAAAQPLPVASSATSLISDAPRPAHGRRLKRLASYPFLNLYLHEGASRALEVEWLGDVSRSALRQSLTDMLELVSPYNIKGLVTDARRLSNMHPDDITWMGTHVLPALLTLGVTRMARFVAPDILSSKLVGDEIKANQRKVNFEVSFFTDIEAARTWACGS
jgi:hypothetical protein